jgi:hypothetical protein
VFNKIAEQIKEGEITEKDKDAIVEHLEKEKNEFDEQKEVDVKSLLVEDDISKEIFDDYGQIEKVTPNTLRGLICYLKVPKDKLGQENRWREIMAKKYQFAEKNQCTSV